MEAGGYRFGSGMMCVLLFMLAGYPFELRAVEQAGHTPAQRHRLIAVGDIMLSGSAAAVFKVKGYSHAFRDRSLAKITSRADASFGNLEYPITRSGFPFQDKKYTFRGPAESLNAIKAAGFDLLSLANNHIMDYGLQGLTDTIRQCKRNKLVCAGAGTDLASASSPGILARRGIRYGLLAYSMTFPEEFWATQDRPGTAHPDWAQVGNDIRDLRLKVDILVVSFHWGEELRIEPKKYQVDYAHYAIASGADMVVGHHPHVPQPVEIYEGKPIFYSLGNYAFGSFSKNTTFGITAEIRFLGTTPEQIILYPLDVHRQEGFFSPRLARGRSADGIVAHLQKISESFGTVIENRDGVGKIQLPPPKAPVTAGPDTAGKRAPHPELCIR